MVGPFIFVDHIGPEDLGPGSGVDIDAHPHIGLSTLTYLFGGRLVHRDSLGTVQTIERGAVNWMTAGSGVSHTERSPEDERNTVRDLHGLQTWVALPDGSEDAPPTFDHQPDRVIPRESSRGATIRLVAGNGFGLTSPVPVSSPLVLAEIQLEDDAALTIGRDQPERALLVLDGQVTLADEALPAGRLAVLDEDAVPRLAGTGAVVLLGGEPVGTRHIWWNFVHSDPERIEDAKQAWTDQRFPTVPDDHHPWVPVPTA